MQLRELLKFDPCVPRVNGFYSLFSDYADTIVLATFIEYEITPMISRIIFDEGRINPGGHYDTTTGVYTVPLDGIYQFYVQIENDIDDNNDWNISLYVAGVRSTFSRHDASGSSESELVSLSSLVLLHLSAGQQVWVEQDATLNGLYGSDAVDTIFSWFFGRLIASD